jgi:hypothetical protein
MNVAAIILLSRLENITPTSDGDQLLALIACLASFTDQRDPWSSPEASDQARLLLNHILETEGRGGRQKLGALLTGLLELHVKPVFVKVKNAAITRQGRKALDPAPGNVASHEFEDIKPWNSDKLYIVTLYGWVLSHLDVLAPRGEVNYYVN